MPVRVGPRRTRAGDGLGLLACLLVTGTAVAVLLAADLYEFSWRYQLPALVTLPIAGALGATALARYVRERRTADAAVRRVIIPGLAEITGTSPPPGSPAAPGRPRLQDSHRRPCPPGLSRHPDTLRNQQPVASGTTSSTHHKQHATQLDSIAEIPAGKDNLPIKGRRGAS